MLTLADIMTREVVTVTPQTTLRDAVELFTAKHISGAPVVSGNTIVGIMSAADILAFAASTPDTPTGTSAPVGWDCSSETAIEDEPERGDVAPGSYFVDLWPDDSADVADRMTSTQGLEWSLLDEHTVDEVMTRGVVTLSPNDDVTAAAELMRARRIHRVIVVEEGRLAGIVSALDVARAVAERTLTWPKPAGSV